jgi:dUTP pyrophosphatase
MDLYAAEDVVLAPGATVTVPTGLRVAIPEGYELQIRPKSGLASKRAITVLNTPGTIDAGYRGEIMVILHNAAPVVAPTFLDTLVRTLDEGDSAVAIAEEADLHLATHTVRLKRGDKIAQAVFAKFVRAHPVHVPLAANETSRGTSGFGSTG